MSVTLDKQDKVSSKKETAIEDAKLNTHEIEENDIPEEESDYDSEVESLAEIIFFSFSSNIYHAFLAGIFMTLGLHLFLDLASQHNLLPTLLSPFITAFLTADDLNIALTIGVIAIILYAGKDILNVIGSENSIFYKVPNFIVSLSWSNILFWNALWAVIVIPFYLAINDISLFNIIVHAILEPFYPLAQSLFPANPYFGSLETFLSWWDSIQLAVWFWIIYFSMLADDLGLPGLKTLFWKVVKKIRG